MITAKARVAPEKAASPARPAFAFFAGAQPEKVMTRKSYWEKLRDPRWQRRKAEIMQRADFACELCEARHVTLNVHHKLYRRGADPWEYADHEIECLCEPCHEASHELRARLDEAIVRFVNAGMHVDMLTGFADGLWASLNPEQRDVSFVVTSAEYAYGMACGMRGERPHVGDELMTESAIVAAVEQGSITVGKLWEIEYPESERPGFDA
jgi:hypothetical protein